MPHELRDEHLMIETLCYQLNAIREASPATSGLNRCCCVRMARGTSMPAFVASSMLICYILGDPLPWR